MLEFFRTHKRLLALIAMIFVIPSFVVTGIYSYNRMNAADQRLATIDGQAVSPYEFDEAKRKVLDGLRQQLGAKFNPTMLEGQEARAQIMGRVLGDRALRGEVAAEHVAVSEQAAIAMIKSAPLFRGTDGKFDPNQYQNFLAQRGKSDAGFVLELRSDMARELLLSAVTASSVVPKTILMQVHNLLGEKREVATLAFNAQDYLPHVKVTDEQAKKHYDASKKSYERPETIDVDYVVLSAEGFAKEYKPDEKAIDEYYKQNANNWANSEQRSARHILITPAAGDKDGVQAKKKADEILAQVKADPAKFAEIAKKESQDPGSAAQGGDLGYFSRNMMVQPFADAVWGAKQGDIVECKSEFGYHVIQVTGIKEASTKPLAEVRGKIIAELARQFGLKRFSEEADNFTNTVYEQSDSLAPVIEKYKLTVMKAKGVRRGMAATQDEAHLTSEVVSELYGPDCLTDKRNSHAQEVGANTLVAARVTAHQKAEIPPFDQVRDQILSDLKMQAAIDEAEKAGKAKMAALQAKPSDEGFGPHATVTRVNFNGETMEVLSSQMAVPAAKLPAYTGARTAKGYVVSHVYKSEMPKADDASIKQQTAELSQMFSMGDQLGYIDGLKVRHGAVVVNPDYMTAEEAAKAAKKK